MAWPRNLGLGSFKVIENGAVRQTMYDFLLVRYCRPNYSSILYRLRVIWRWVSWPRNLVKKSLKIIETGAIRKLGCCFLSAIHSNYGAILYRLRLCERLIGRKSEIFIPHVYLSPLGGDPVGISWRCLMLIKLEWLEYRNIIGELGRATRWCSFRISLLTVKNIQQ